MQPAPKLNSHTPAKRKAKAKAKTVPHAKSSGKLPVPFIARSSKHRHVFNEREGDTWVLRAENAVNGDRAILRRFHDQKSISVKLVTGDPAGSRYREYARILLPAGVTDTVAEKVAAFVATQVLPE